MNNSFFLVAYILLLLLIFLPIWLSNRKKKKKFNEMISNLKVGDKIETIGGIYAKISKILDYSLEVQIDKGVTMTISKGAVAKVVE